MYPLDDSGGFCYVGAMASVLKAKYKCSPSGKVAFTVAHIPVSAPCQSRQTSTPTKKSQSEGKPAVSSQKGRAGYGELGRKSKASWKTLRNVRERMAAGELEYGKNQCWFVTLTQPSIDPRAFEALARYSSYALNRINQWLLRRFGTRDFFRVSVWEYQKRGSLHLHLMLAANFLSADLIEDFQQGLAAIWYRILGDISKRFESLPHRASDGHDWKLEELQGKKRIKNFCDVQQIKKSIVAYLSTYLSNSNHGNKSSSKQALREKFFPIATWCQWSRRATALMEKFTDEIELGECEPDKKPELERRIDAMRQKVTPAPDTDVLPSQNPYTVGLYYIPPADSPAIDAPLWAGFIASIAHMFRPKLRDDRAREYNADIVQTNDACTEQGLDVELTVRKYYRALRIAARRPPVINLIRSALLRFAPKLAIMV